MKKILAFILVVAVMACFAACGSDTDTTTTITTVPTTLSQADANRVGFAKLGFEELMNYLNICAAYGVPIEVNDNDTIDDIIARIRQAGGEVAANNILTSKKFFDYAKKNPDVENGTGVYVIREEADWLALYVD
ncbi:MAG: hypothetical protein IKU25_01845 [Clostridia bacterium]|nr:hypothetical protein [Clostridia bacterium]